jgi:glycosyltransferase involved in cell wall biosynthesis
MIRIIHPLLCYYPSQAGGPANTLYWINSSLNPTEFKTVVVATNLGIQQPLTQINLEGNGEVLFFKSQGLQFLQKSIAKLDRGDIIQFSSLFFPPTLPLLIAGLIKGKVIVISPRGELYQAALNIKPIKKKIWKGIVKLFQRQINFHATNKYEQEIIRCHFPKAKGIDIIPNYLLLPQKLEEKVLPQFVFLGRINPLKNIDLLIKALAEVGKNDKYKDIQLTIVGSARLPYEKEYEKKLHALTKALDLVNNIKFMGHVAGREKDKILATSLALVLPSQSENFGNVVLEALAQGTPVIASKNTPWEMLESYNAGYWVNPELTTLTQALTTVLDLEKEKYIQMRINAYALCKSKFDIKSNINHWENYYKNITADV